MTHAPPQRQRLAQGLAVLWDRLGEAEAPEVFDVAIVGSGYGGSVAAECFAGARVADAGGERTLKVLLLERGQEYLPGEFPGRFADVPRHVRLADRDASRTRFNQRGLFDLRLGDDVTALVANGLGGGSLINAGVLLEPDPTDFAPGPWRRQLERLRDNGTFDAARRLLGGGADGAAPASIDVHPAVPKQGLRKTIALQTLARAAGATCTKPPLAVAMGERVNSAGVRLPACTLCGDCLTGCNVGAKDSLDVNLLRRAARRPGFEVFTGATVLSLRRGPTAGERRHHDELGTPLPPHWVLRVVHTNPRLQDREPLQLVVRAHHVVLAAGTLGSTEILLRSRTERLVFSDRVGAGFSCNGDNLAAVYRMNEPVQACAPETTSAGKLGRDVGPTITASLRVSGRRRPFLVQEFAVPAPLARLFDEAVTTSHVLASLPVPDCVDHRAGEPALDPCAVDPQAMARTLLVGVIGHDDAAGVLLLPKNPRPADRPAQQGTLRIRWPAARYGCDLEDAHGRLGELVQALPHGAGAPPQLLANPVWRLLPDPLEKMVAQPRGPVLTVHPLGGCGIGRHCDAICGPDRDGVSARSAGVVDECGRVYDLAPADGDAWFGTLVVLDGSIIPGSLGVNPALTIAAVALDACRQLRQDWQGQAADAAAAATPVVERPTVRPPHPLPGTAPGTTQVEVIERLSGMVRLADGPEVFAELTLAYAPCVVQSLMSTMQRKLVVHEESSRLRLFRAEQWRDDRNDLRAGSDADRERFVAFEAKVNGTLQLLHRERSRRVWRVLRSTTAWLRNRGLRDTWQRVFEPKPPRRARPACAGEPARRTPLQWLREKRQRLVAFLASAGRAGEVRRFDYRLELGEVKRRPPDAAELSAFVTGAVITGHKRLTYGRRANPWRQLTWLTLTEFPSLSPPATLRVDPRFLAGQGVPLLRITGQADGASALADLVSFGLYMARLVLGIHLWAFRKPDAPRRDAPQRLPGPIAGLPAPEVTEFETDRPTPGGRRVLVRLTHYPRPQAADLPPLAMVHGYSVSGTTFTHPSLRPSAAEYFWRDSPDGHRRGRDIWVVDLRTSAGLPTATEPWAIEQPALVDLPAALLHIRNATGRRVDVLAHCIGCAMLGMALLTDAVRVRSGGTQLGVDTWLTNEQLGVLAAFNGRGGGPHPCVNRIVLSQKGPVLRYTDGNVLRAWAMQALRRVLLDDDYQFRPGHEPTLSDDLLDRVLASLPYPDADYDVENPWQPWRRTRWTTTRHRMDALYGRDFNAENMRRETLEAIDDLFGPIHLATVAQTIHFARFNMVTNQRGRGEFVTLANLERRWRGIPTLAVHGRDNGLADVSTQHLLRTYLVSAGVAFEREVFDHMGHQDSLIGRDAVRVFERIGRFLDAAPAMPAPRAALPGERVADVPWLGPRIDMPDPPPALEGAEAGEQAAQAAGGKNLLRIASIGRPDQGDSELLLVPAVLPHGGRGPQVQAWDECIVVGAKEPDNPRGWQFADVGDEVLAALQRRGNQRSDGQAGWLALHLYEVGETTARVRAEPSTSGTGGASKGGGEGVPRETNPRGPRGRTQVIPPPAFERGGDPAGRAMRPQGLIAEEQPFASAAGAGREAAVSEAQRAASRRLQSVADQSLSLDEDEARLAFVRLDDLRRVRQSAAASEPAGRLTIALASCQYPASLLDASPAWASLRRLAECLDETDLVLFVGDQIYADATGGVADPTRSDERYEQPSESALRVRPLREILRRRPACMLPDDHEIDDNWEPPNAEVARLRAGEAAQAEHARRSGLGAWRLYQRMRSGAAAPPSGDLGLRYGGYPILMLDTRTRRSARGTPVPSAQVHLIDAWQRERLQQWLRLHRDEVKFVVTSSLLLPPRLATAHELADPRTCGSTIANDAWDGFPLTLAWLLELLAREGIGRTVFLSGDEHHSLCCRATLQLGSRPPVHLVSVHGSALYAPYPFANGRPQDLLGSGPLQVGPVQLQLETAFAPPGDGYVRVVVERQDGGVRLGVQFMKGAAPEKDGDDKDAVHGSEAPIWIELR